MRIRVYCKGIQPLLFLKKPEVPDLPVGDYGEEWQNLIHEVAAQSLWVENGRIVVPVAWVNQVVTNAMYSLSKKRHPPLEIEETFLPLTLNEEGWLGQEAWKPDYRRVPSHRDPRQKVWLVRPRFDRWGFWVTFNLHGAKSKTLERILSKAGKKGLGGFTNGTFGRFKVETWEILNEPLEY